MTSLQEIIQFSTHKTRVLIFTSHQSISKLVLDVLHFSGKEFDYFLSDQEFKNEENDFVLFETSDVSKAAEFRPNIVFISKENDFEKLEPLLKNVVSGGIVIFPKELENEMEEQIYYFRKLPSAEISFQKNDGQIILDTEIGEIPLLSKDENLVKNIDGIKLLSQQFGIMEEEFFEALMGFE